MSEEGQERQLRGKASRACQILLHNNGRKSYANKRVEVTKAEGEVGPLRFFELTHTMKKTGHLNNVAANVVENVNKKIAEEVGDSNISSTDRFNLEQKAFNDVLGPEHPGRLRGYGFGATASLVRGPGKTSRALNLEIQELRRQLEEMKHKDEEKSRQIAEMTEKEKEKDERIKKLEDGLDLCRTYILSSQASSGRSTRTQDVSEQNSRSSSKLD